jgi:hypothetical protein
MRIEAGDGLSGMQSRSRSQGAILQKMRHRDRSFSTSVGWEVH